MKDFIFNTFFKEKVNELEYYKRQFNIINANAPDSIFKQMLPSAVEIEGEQAFLDFKNIRYINGGGDVLISVEQCSNRTKSQYLMELLYKVSDATGVNYLHL